MTEASILAFVRQSASRSGGSPALGAPGREWLSYAALLDTLEKTARALASRGIGRNDRVAIVLPNGPEMATVFLAVSAVATAAPLNPGYREKEFEFYLSDLEARALVIAGGQDSPSRGVAAAKGIPVLEIVPDAAAPAGVFEVSDGGAGTPVEFASGGDVALMLHTSGTTSRPKMVPLSHVNLCASAQHVMGTLELTGADRCLNVMPLFHIHGIVAALLSSLRAGASVACSEGFVAPKFFDWIDECRPSWYTAVPTMHQAILDRAKGNGEVIGRRPLRFIRSSSASLPPKVMAALEGTFGVPVIESYGMTEAAHQMASNRLPPGRRKPGSVGMASGPEVAIMDEAGNPLPRGETGEIVIRGPNVTSGYLGNPEANAAAFTNGWFRTGDEGRFDDEDYLYLTGRIKEIINRAGEKIAPREIDEALLEHPAVRQAVAFALPDERLGEDVAAAVVLREGAAASEGELRTFVARRLADFKIPRLLVFVDEIPKGPTGKLQRIGLAERLGVSGEAAGRRTTVREFTAPRNPTEEALAKIWAGELGLEKVGVTDDFFALGGYSVLAARVFVRIEEVFGKRLPMTVLFEAATVEALAAILDGGGGTAGPLVRIREGDGVLPLFCIANSDAVVFANLARRLGPRQTVYGLHPQGLIPVEDCRIDIADLASKYLERVMEVRPEGPYLLVGTCTSGVVAMEMARQLRQRGGETALLAMIDPPGPWTPTDWTFYGLRRVRRVLRHLAHHARQILRLPFGQKGRYLLSNLRRVSGRLTEARRDMPRTRLAYEQVYWRALKAARLRYEPAEYEGSAILFLSPQDIRTPGSGSGRRWIELAGGGAAVCEVRAVHREMLREPYVRTIARRLYDDIGVLRRKYGFGEEAAESPAAAAGEVGPVELVPPRTPLEQRLCGIWADILAVEDVGVDDHFLYLGGDSVLAARVVSRIRMDLGVEIEMTDFLMSPTVAQLALVVGREMSRKFGGDRSAQNDI